MRVNGIADQAPTGLQRSLTISCVPHCDAGFLNVLALLQKSIGRHDTSVFDSSGVGPGEAVVARRLTARVKHAAISVPSVHSGATRTPPAPV